MKQRSGLLDISPLPVDVWVGDSIDYSIVVVINKVTNPLKPVEDDDRGPIEDHQAAQVKMKAFLCIIYLYNFICSF